MLSVRNSKYNDIDLLRSKGWKKLCSAKANQRRFEWLCYYQKYISKQITKDERRYYILIKESVHQGKITVLNVYILKNRNLKYTKQKLKEVKVPWKLIHS